MKVSYTTPKLEEVAVTFTATVATYNRDKIWEEGKLLRALTEALEQFQKIDNFSIGKIMLSMKADE